MPTRPHIHTSTRPHIHFCLAAMRHGGSSENLRCWEQQTHTAGFRLAGVGERRGYCACSTARTCLRRRWYWIFCLGLAWPSPACSLQRSAARAARQHQSTASNRSCGSHMHRHPLCLLRRPGSFSHAHHCGMPHLLMLKGAGRLRKHAIGPPLAPARRAPYLMSASIWLSRSSSSALSSPSRAASSTLACACAQHTPPCMQAAHAPPRENVCSCTATEFHLPAKCTYPWTCVQLASVS